MRRVGSQIAALLWAVVAGCAADPPGGSAGVGVPAGRCSDLSRLLTRYQGREAELCGAPDEVFRELIPVGQGYFIARNLLTNATELWGVDADGSLGGGPRAVSIWTPGLSTRSMLLISLGQDRALAYDQKTGQRVLMSVKLAAAPTESPLSPIPDGSGSVPRIVTGRDLVMLDGTHVLDWEPGTGEFRVWLYDRAHETSTPFPTTSFAGRRDTFLRGHRLIPLGPGKLLEWVPVEGTFRVWSYAFDPTRIDPFEMLPDFEGTSDLTRDHEVMLLDPGRLLFWNRLTGEIAVRALDPNASNPLVGAPKGADQDDRLMALPRDWAPNTKSAIRRVFLIVQRGRSFDHHFGHYCQGGPDAELCHEGPGCCEAMPTMTPGADQCYASDPTIVDHVPNDSDACLTEKMHDGAMDRFVMSTLDMCGDPFDFACVRPESAGAFGVYHRLAARGALADRCFAVVGDWLVNANYFFKTGFGSPATEGGETILSLLSKQLVPWAIYLEDPFLVERLMQGPPTHYDARWSFFRWFDEFWHDLDLRQLAPVTIVQPPDRMSEMPGAGPPASGANLVGRIVDAIEQSSYRDETLVLVVHLTSGGFYDHVRPPPRPAVTTDPFGPIYGPRVPLLALGPFAKSRYVSHVELEMSSLTTFLEWNWLGGVTGQLGGRDQIVNNIGDLLSTAAGTIPRERAPAAAP